MKHAWCVHRISIVSFRADEADHGPAPLPIDHTVCLSAPAQYRIKYQASSSLIPSRGHRTIEMELCRKYCRANDWLRVHVEELFRIFMNRIRPRRFIYSLFISCIIACIDALLCVPEANRPTERFIGGPSKDPLRNPERPRIFTVGWS